MFSFYLVTYLNFIRLILISHCGGCRLLAGSITDDVFLNCGGRCAIVGILISTSSNLLCLIKHHVPIFLTISVKAHLLPSILSLEMVRSGSRYSVHLVLTSSAVLELLHLNLVEVLLLLQIELKSTVSGHGG
jgi:hypothetical protein